MPYKCAIIWWEIFSPSSLALKSITSTSQGFVFLLLRNSAILLSPLYATSDCIKLFQIVAITAQIQKYGQIIISLMGIKEGISRAEPTHASYFLIIQPHGGWRFCWNLANSGFFFRHTCTRPTYLTFEIFFYTAMSPHYSSPINFCHFILSTFKSSKSLVINTLPTVNSRIFIKMFNCNV